MVVTSKTLVVCISFRTKSRYFCTFYAMFYVIQKKLTENFSWKICFLKASQNFWKHHRRKSGTSCFITIRIHLFEIFRIIKAKATGSVYLLSKKKSFIASFKCENFEERIESSWKVIWLGVPSNPSELMSVWFFAYANPLPGWTFCVKRRYFSKIAHISAHTAAAILHCKPGACKIACKRRWKGPTRSLPALHAVYL